MKQVMSSDFAFQVEKDLQCAYTTSDQVWLHLSSLPWLRAK